MTQYTVIDGFRRITFEGELLARASSQRPHRWRWTDLRLYRTAGTGTFILEKIGASRVMHVPDCTDVISDLPRFQEVYPGEDPENPKFQYCRCVPDTYDFTSLLVEQDRHWAQISNSATAVVNALVRHRAGSHWMPRTSADLLTKASDVDADIREAYTQTDSVII